MLELPYERFEESVLRVLAGLAPRLKDIETAYETIMEHISKKSPLSLSLRSADLPEAR